MKAAFMKKTGGLDVIEYGDLPDPKLEDGQLLIKTLAVAPAHVDNYIRAGKFPLQISSPYILCRNFVGEVVKVAPDVEDFEEGQLVWSVAAGDDEQGSAAELIARDSALCYPLPNGVDPIEAAAALDGAVTACRGIITASNLLRGGIFFIHGASGCVGTALIQLGKARGAIVFASTSSKEKMEWCKEQGADKVFDYTKKDFISEVKKEAGEGVNAFCDTSRQPNLELATELLKIGGTIVLFTGGDGTTVLPLGGFYRKELAMKGFSVYHATATDLSNYAMIINRAFEEGLLKTKIAKTFSLKETKKAFELLEAKPPIWGRVVLTF